MLRLALVLSTLVLTCGGFDLTNAEGGGATNKASNNYKEYLAAKRAVCHYFGGYCSQAMAVVKCETGGTYSTWAENGQYKNIFQMGSSERSKYGWHTVGSSVWIAAKSAYNYFVASGKDWSPWECKPY